METIDHSVVQQDVKKTFWNKGTCSQTFLYLLNQAFNHPQAMEEKAMDPLAGGILRRGHQCGMLWGAALAVGAEAYRQCDDKDEAIGKAIVATQYVMDSFLSRTKSANCKDITGCNFMNPLSFAKYMVSGKFRGCFQLAEDWAPEALDAAVEGLADNEVYGPYKPVSCASEVLKHMGATDEEQVMVAGLAGGMGLSGNGCGALGAAIWYRSLKYSKDHGNKSTYNNPEARKAFKNFLKLTKGEVKCEKICGRCFDSEDDHSIFIQNGGCAELIEILANS